MYSTPVSLFSHSSLAWGIPPLLREQGKFVTFIGMCAALVKWKNRRVDVIGALAGHANESGAVKLLLTFCIAQLAASAGSFFNRALAAELFSPLDLWPVDF